MSNVTRGIRILSGSLCSRSVSGVRLLPAGEGGCGQGSWGGGAQREGQGSHRSGVPGSRKGWAHWDQARTLAGPVLC